MTTCDRGVVAALCDGIVQRIGEPRYRLWFENHTKFCRDDDQLVVGVPNHFFQDWLQKTFADDVRAAAAEVFGQITAVRFVIDPELFQAARRAQEEQCVTAVVKVNAATEKGSPQVKAEEPRSEGGRKVASKQPCLFSEASPIENRAIV